MSLRDGSIGYDDPKEVLAKTDFDPATLWQWGTMHARALIEVLKDCEAGQKVVYGALRRIGLDVGRQVLAGGKLPERLTEAEFTSFYATIEANAECLVDERGQRYCLSQAPTDTDEAAGTTSPPLANGCSVTRGTRISVSSLWFFLGAVVASRAGRRLRTSVPHRSTSSRLHALRGWSRWKST